MWSRVCSRVMHSTNCVTKASLVLDLRWFGLITNQWRFRYDRRLNVEQDAGFVDVRLGWSGGGFELFAEATNLQRCGF